MSRMVHVEGADDYYASPAAEKTKTALMTGKGKVYDAIMFNNSGAADYYMLIFDSITALVGGEVPNCAPQLVPRGTTGWLTWPMGKPMKTGITIAASTTSATYTAIAANDVMFDVTFRVR